MKKYVVRVVQTEDQEGGDISKLVESLRYAGLLTVHEPEGLTLLCFDIPCPKGLDSKMWAHQNAGRMQSFGFNAVAAPSTI